MYVRSTCTCTLYFYYSEVSYISKSRHRSHAHNMRPMMLTKPFSLVGLIFLLMGTTVNCEMPVAVLRDMHIISRMIWLRGRRTSTVQGFHFLIIVMVLPLALGFLKIFRLKYHDPSLFPVMRETCLGKVFKNNCTRCLCNGPCNFLFPDLTSTCKPACCRQLASHD